MLESDCLGLKLGSLTCYMKNLETVANLPVPQFLKGITKAKWKLSSKYMQIS